MATQAYSIFIFNGKKQLADSSALDILFKSIAVGTLAHGLVISDVSGAFDFNAKALSNIGGIALASGTVTNIATPSAGTDAANKTYVDTQRDTRVAKSGDTMTGNLTMSGATVTGLPTPSASSDAAPKSYVDAVSVGARMKLNVAVATTANISLSSAPSTIDGYTLQAGDRILVKDQTTGTQNGLYDFASAGSALTRSADLDNSPTGEIYNGVLVPRVENGSTNTGKAYVISSIGTGTAGLHTIGTDAVTWTVFASPINYSAGAGIYFSGTTILANPDGVTLDAGGASANGTATLEIKNGGVGTTQLAATSVTAAKLGSDVAGTALSGGNGSALAVNFDNITLDAGGAGGALEIKTSGVGSTQLASSAVTTAKLAATSVTAAKLGSDVAGSGLTGGNGSALAVSVGTETGVMISGGNVVADYDRTLTNGSASVGISAGQILYMDTGGKVQLAKANVSNLDQFALFIGDSTIAAGTSNTGRCVARLGAIYGGFSSLTIGADVYVSRATAGAVTQDPSTSTGNFVSGEYVYKVGRAVSATEIRFEPEFMWQYA